MSTFSKIFDKARSNDIGLYDVTSSIDLLGLGIIMTSDTFQSNGTYLKHNAMFTMQTSFFIQFFGNMVIFVIFPQLLNRTQVLFLSNLFSR